MNHASDHDKPNGREGLKLALNNLMERVREDALAQERLMAQDPKAGERAARLRILLNEARRRLENVDRPAVKSPDDPAAAP
ncbi:hypothetical protein [Hydrogenophaga sp.]|uniref:hypothetical protein n=1 Tax=Hydrogenophaga sp. TaxID=1904254 RepID=UPI0027271028|nr:hypothetical protein [Hydrogenophaga sp.]MDO9146962.1 hypothetical protein [Hydrogenophaga sp.]MDP3326314.1 hypothetical protein [Hydrogenophaga sp.]MDP3885150.1 hypothetical protein [Hydrogenophaga sp.]